ncbi:hypothetical protein [Robertmurraya mangrovi]|nr:hypothetical protein [Bacillus sp. 31A1R]
MDHSILDLHAFREQKQMQGEEKAADLLEKAQAFTERYANIRESVRAKSLFRKLLSLPEDSRLTPIQERIYSEWFLHDYKTIQGLTMFNLFLRNHAKELSEPDLIQGALFLTSTFEPVKVKKVIQNKFELSILDLYSNEEYILVQRNMELSEVKENGTYFIRKIPLMIRSFGIGGVYPFHDIDILNEMQKEFLLQKQGIENYTWRAFLKKNAVKYIF